MAEFTSIEWADHTFNPWTGCTKVSPACDHCYAEGWAKRSGQVEWGSGKPRRRTRSENWNKPLRWQANAKLFHVEHGRRQRVFGPSLADPFDNEVPEGWRFDYFRLIEDCPDLDWMLLTKRIGNVMGMLPERWNGILPENVWIGATICNQAEADRDIPKLLDIPARIRFLSMEPLLGEVDLEEAWHGESALDGECWGECGWCPAGYPPLHNCQQGRQSSAVFEKGRSGLDWVIVGGESGPNARPMHPDWARTLRDQCAAASVPFLFKQWGEWVCEEQSPADATFPGVGYDPFGTGEYWAKLGKKCAGRLLDGITHDGFPAWV